MRIPLSTSSVLATAMVAAVLASGVASTAEPPARNPIPDAFRKALKPGEPFPLTPGWRWTYQREGTDALFVESYVRGACGKVDATRLRSIGDTFFWATELGVAARNGEVVACGSLGEGLVVLLPGNIDKGISWLSPSAAKAVPWGFDFSGSVVKQEVVETPAGNFTAWQIEYALGFHLGTEYDLRAWYAPGIGFVKIARWRLSQGGSNPRKQELDEPLVYDLARVEAIAEAHPIDLPSPPMPIEKLPKHIPAPEDQVTLFADYADRWLGGVMLYAINRTNEEVKIPCEPDSIGPVRLEAQWTDGAWCRAQTKPSRHGQPTGRTLFIEPQHFILMLGWLPAHGEEREGRYRLRVEGQDVVSNVGKVLVDPAAIGLVRYNTFRHTTLDIETTDISVELIREVLFSPIGLSRGAERDWIQRNAILRLAEIPRDMALLVLSEALATETLLQSHIATIAALLGEIDPDRFQPWALNLLKEGPPRFRTALLENPFVLTRGDDRDVQKLLLEQLRNPKTSDLGLIMSHLASFKRPEVGDLLATIEKDSRYPEEARIAAGYHRARWFGTDALGLYQQPDHIEGSDFIAAGLPFVVRITNATEDRIAFSYDKPHEILCLYLELETEESPARFLIPKPGITWFPFRQGPGTNLVRLAPGQSHEVRVKFRDYFEIPRRADLPRGSFLLSATLAIPGIHKVPQLCGGAIAWTLERQP